MAKGNTTVLSDFTHNTPPRRSRGAISNPANRFESLSLENDPDGTDDFEPSPVRTEFYRDATKSVLTRNSSPDVPFDLSINPYRGCEHGCVYCFARPTHEFLGFSSGLDFESRIVVKENAPELLRQELAKRSYRPEPIALSPNTDSYQPIERRLKLTRRCLEVFAECRNPVGIVTKNALVTRDLDLLQELANYDAVNVFISVTSLDSELRRILEPRTSPPAARLRAIRELSGVGIPTGVLVAPIIPAINDHEITKIIAAAAEAGATSAGYVILRLPHAVAPMFEEWLDQHFPDRKDKVLNQVRSMRGGELYESQFGRRMTGSGIHAEKITQMFEIAVRRAKLNGRPRTNCPQQTSAAPKATNWICFVYLTPLASLKRANRRKRAPTGSRMIPSPGSAPWVTRPPRMNPPGTSSVAAVRQRETSWRTAPSRFIRASPAANAIFISDSSVPCAWPSRSISRCVSLAPVSMYQPTRNARKASSSTPRLTKTKSDHQPNLK